MVSLWEENTGVIFQHISLGSILVDKSKCRHLNSLTLQTCTAKERQCKRYCIEQAMILGNPTCCQGWLQNIKGIQTTQ